MDYLLLGIAILFVTPFGVAIIIGIGHIIYSLFKGD